MFEIVMTVLGLTAAAVYVGYLAYAIHAVPLWIIAVGTFALAIREFWIELRGGRNGKGSG